MKNRFCGNPVHGWLSFDKPAGLTATRAVNIIQRAFNARKAGHAGTLDPLATGILPIALGEATKVASRAVNQIKIYKFTIKWGEKRDTDDSSGRLLEVNLSRPTESEVRESLLSFIGKIEQIPPAFSAIKVNGKRAYDLARKGTPPTLKPRVVEIYKLALIGFADPNHAELSVTCGKGTYVRSLARDIGDKIGCLGHISALRRLQVGPFEEANAISLDKVAELGHKGHLLETLLPVETVLVDIPALTITESEATRLKFGQAIRLPNKLEGTVYLMENQRLVAIARADRGEFKPLRVFNI